MAKIISLEIGQVRIDGGTQVRAVIDKERVAHYSDRMKAGDEFPPCIVYFDKKEYWLADGFHRIHGAVAARLKMVRCESRPGTREDALWYALAANKNNGAHMSLADKIHALKLALTAFGQESDSKLAEQMGVKAETVAKYRAELPGATIPFRDSRVGKDGRTYNVTNIGKKKASPKPTPGQPNPTKPAEAPKPASPTTPQNETYDDSSPTEPPPQTPPQGPTPTDKPGKALPDDPAIREAFARADEMREQARKIRQIKNDVAASIKAGDRLYSFLTKTAFEADMTQAAEGLEAAIPYAVCRFCGGGAAGRKQRDDCTACKGQGWTGELFYKTAVPKELKD